MPSRTLLSLSIATLALGGALWFLSRPTDAPCGEVAAEDALAADPEAAVAALDDAARNDAARDAAASAAVPAPPVALVEPMRPADDCSVSDHLDELVEDLGALAWSATDHDTRRLEAHRLERFVLDAVGCGQAEATRAALRERLATADDRLRARLVVALVGLGADAELPELWTDVGADDRAGVLVALAWDPLHAGAAPPLDAARVDPFVAGDPLLPLELGRAPAAKLRGWLVERLRDGGDPTDDGDAVRDAAAVALGFAAAEWPAASDALVEAVLARPREARAPLFMLLRDGSPASRQAIERLRSRDGGFRGLAADDLEGHEHFAIELAEAEAAARDDLPDAATLAAALATPAGAAARLQSMSLALARLVDGGVDAGDRAQLSDGLCAALRAPADRDSDWTGLLALVRLHVYERYQPQLSIGYGTQTPTDRHRSDERLEIFLRHLADESPAQRRLAVMGLFGSTDGEAVREALSAALVSEEDRGVASWIRLALIRL